MLNSFWNLCRVCPSMPIDKLNSEYRTHFKWHDTYSAPIHEVIRHRPEIPICSEPAIPRRKKHPELAYRTNEVLRMVNGGDSSDSLDTESVTSRDVIKNRARPEERSQVRNRVSPRSKSVDPYLGRRRPMSAHLASNRGKGVVVHNILATDVSAGEAVPHRLHYTRRHFDTKSSNPVVVDQLMTQSYPPAAHTPLPPPISSESATIRKITEYRSQFAWPRSSESTPLHESTPRKSISMGAIQLAQHAPTAAPAQRAAGHSTLSNAVIHGQGTAAAGLASGRKSRNGPHIRMMDQLEDSVIRSPPPGTEEPIVVAKRVSDKETELPNVHHEDNVTDQKQTESRPRKFKTEYKSKFRAPAKYAYVEGSWKKMSRSADSAELQKEESNSLPWYGEVIELRKKAGEYKHRSLGGNLASEHLADVYSRQDIFEQLSARSNLSALALATTPRDKGREETKEALRKPSVKKVKKKDNNAAKRATATTTPHLQAVRRPNSWKKAKGFDSGGDETISTPRSQSLARHHLERTTPAAGETGVLITSPTRDHKLEPVDLKRSGLEGKASPDKTKPSPKASPRIAESKAITKGVTAAPSSGTSVQSRSASASAVHRSPKRTPRPVSMIVPGSKAQVNGVYNGTGMNEPPTARKTEPKRPRPTSLATGTAAVSRPKTAPSSRGTSRFAHGDDPLPKTHLEPRSRPASSISSSAGSAAAKHASITQQPQPPPPSLRTSAAKPSATVPPPPPASKPVASAHIMSRSYPLQPVSGKGGGMMVNGDDLILDKNGKGIDPVDNKLKSDESKEIEETLMMKSPPEPTRVKSPEQILVRSPEPVKWTIPLETGIKWTGTPKIEGESYKMGKDESRSPPSIVSSPVDTSSPAITSQEMAGATSPKSGESVSPQMGPMTSPSSTRSLASDVLERARTRFDQFWGKSKDK